MKKLLLVDFENVPKVDLSALPADVTVPFFFGASQRTVPTAFLKEALKLGSRFVPIDIEGQGKNALDFHIAFYLGEYLQAAPGAECVILSRDKGFDPLVRHLAGRGFKVRRVGSIGDAFHAAVAIGTVSTLGAPVSKARAPRNPGPRSSAVKVVAAATQARSPRRSAPVPAVVAIVDPDRVKALLRKMPGKNLPRRRKKLAAMLASAFAAQKPSKYQIEHLIDALIAAGIVQENAGALSFPSLNVRPS
jgi:hypothetical protein